MLFPPFGNLGEWIILNITNITFEWIWCCSNPIDILKNAEEKETIPFHLNRIILKIQVLTIESNIHIYFVLQLIKFSDLQPN